MKQKESIISITKGLSGSITPFGLRGDLDRHYEKGRVISKTDTEEVRLITHLTDGTGAIPTEPFAYAKIAQACPDEFGLSYSILTLPEVLPFIMEDKVPRVFGKTLPIYTGTELFPMSTKDGFKYAVFHGVGCTQLTSIPSIAKSEEIDYAPDPLDFYFEMFTHKGYRVSSKQIGSHPLFHPEILSEEGIERILSGSVSRIKKIKMMSGSEIVKSSSEDPYTAEYGAIIDAKDTALFLMGKRPARKRVDYTDPLYSVGDMGYKMDSEYLITDPLFVAIMGGKDLAERYLKFIGPETGIYDDKIRSTFSSLHCGPLTIGTDTGARLMRIDTVYAPEGACAFFLKKKMIPKYSVEWWEDRAKELIHALGEGSTSDDHWRAYVDLDKQYRDGLITASLWGSEEKAEISLYHFVEDKKRSDSYFARARKTFEEELDEVDHSSLCFSAKGVATLREKYSQRPLVLEYIERQYGKRFPK